MLLEQHTPTILFLTTGMSNVRPQAQKQSAEPIPGPIATPLESVDTDKGLPLSCKVRDHAHYKEPTH